MRSRGVLHKFGPAGAVDAERPSESYRTLLAQHWGPLLRYAVSILRSDEAVEDVVQTAFVRLWEQRGLHDSQNDVAFLYRTVRNLAFNERRWLRVRAAWRGGDLLRWGGDPTKDAVLVTMVAAAPGNLPLAGREICMPRSQTLLATNPNLQGQ